LISDAYIERIDQYNSALKCTSINGSTLPLGASSPPSGAVFLPAAQVLLG